MAAARRDQMASADQGRALALPSPEPWPQPVGGAALLTEMSVAIQRYVVVEYGAAETVALWALHGHTLDAFSISPRLAITSPEKNCGKTTLLDVIGGLVPRPLITANATTAAIFRSIEVARPSLLIDEADSFLEGREELRGILNSGHRRNGCVLRVVGEDHEPTAFSTWAATAIALIGRLAPTLEDSSLIVRMRRRRHDEVVSREAVSTRRGRLRALNALWFSSSITLLTLLTLQSGPLSSPRQSTAPISVPQPPSPNEVGAIIIHDQFWRAIGGKL
jgi:hypothetical protein